MLNRRDRFHEEAARTWHRLRDERERIHTHSYVLVETFALVQARMGLEPVRALRDGLLPVIYVTWIDAQLHDRALAALLTARRRDISFVDHVSFASMRRFGLQRAFSFDPHFAEEGFELL